MGHGQFSGDPQAVWLTEDGTEDRDMRVLQPFSFTDPAGKIWPAPKDSIVDGASIPRALWTIVGSPYTGDYRRASIVHDVACQDAGNNSKKRRAADRMFFHACRAGGCSIWQSTILYLGVRIGAAAPNVPAWFPAVATESAGPRIRRTDAEMMLEQDFQAIADRVLAQGESDDPEEVEDRADEALAFFVAAIRNPQRQTKKSATRPQPHPTTAAKRRE
jgi:Protein of unknown function (DUF1353)